MIARVPMSNRHISKKNRSRDEMDHLMIECMSQKLEMSVLMSTIFVPSATINATAVLLIIKNDENQFQFLIIL